MSESMDKDIFDSLITKYEQKENRRINAPAESEEKE